MAMQQRGDEWQPGTPVGSETMNEYAWRAAPQHPDVEALTIAQADVGHREKVASPSCIGQMARDALAEAVQA